MGPAASPVAIEKEEEMTLSKLAEVFLGGRKVARREGKAFVPRVSMLIGMGFTEADIHRAEDAAVRIERFTEETLRELR